MELLFHVSTPSRSDADVGGTLRRLNGDRQLATNHAADAFLLGVDVRLSRLAVGVGRGRQSQRCVYQKKKKPKHLRAPGNAKLTASTLADLCSSSRCDPSSDFAHQNFQDDWSCAAHSFKVMSPLPENRVVVPSARQLTESPCPVKVRRHSPLCTSQTLMVLSRCRRTGSCR